MSRTHRREFLKAVGVLGATATLGAEFAHSATGADESSGSWPTVRGNAGRTGATADSGPGPNVTTDWSFDMGGGMYTVEPVVGDGTLFLAVATSHTPSTSEGYVAAYDPATGDELWKRDDVSRPGTPTVDGGTVYFDTYGSEDADATGFFALDGATGETKWHRDASFGVGSPLVAAGRLYCTVSGDACELDPETGDVVWKTADTGGDACFADGALFYGDGVALSADDGSLLWDVSGDDDELRTVAEGLVYGTVNGSDAPNVVRARSAADGTVRWSYSLETEDYWRGDRLAVAGGRVFLRYENTIRALDAETGEEAWTYEADAELAGGLTVGGDTLYAGGRTNPESDAGDAVVVAVNAASGEREWRYAFGGWEFDEYGPAANTPVVADGRVFTATYPMGSTLDWTYTEHGDFHVLRSADGQVEETTETSDTTTEETTTETTKTTARTTSGTKTSAEATETTTGSTTATAQLSGTSEMTTSGSAGNVGTTTTAATATDGQPGFGILAAVGGLAGVSAYLRGRLGKND
ncbi:PQQ-like beta-propeller repeat protein [Haladaptatus salinisoli]|uniref:PQQ-like beta-propeller repeat protein n=1 Tax=Haladaptatus salinisoli TaxID=2884876 RepID=UPI001D0A93A4|nr:PQQ-like beta-propeller repeat protein [Haladaptatus salinisoli]